VARCRIAERLRSNLPFDAGSFDGAYMIHVGINVKAKALTFAEIRRVLKTDAVFGIYDVMREGEGELSFPLPWASSAEMSCVEGVSTYRSLLDAAGFDFQKERRRHAYAIEFLHQVRPRAAANNGLPPAGPGLHLLLGPATPQRIQNLTSAVERGVIAPMAMLGRAR
jgi:SAM-dependent methyltransferase